MGHTATAECGKCHYAATYTVGAGLLTFRTVAWFPVVCRACRALRSADFGKTPLSCGDCGSTDVLRLDAPGMCNNDSNRVIEAWGDLKLTDSLYRCPKCNAFDLRLARGGGVMFD